MRLFLKLTWLLVAALAAAPADALDNPQFDGSYLPVQATRPSITGDVAPGWTDNSSWADVTVRYAKQTTGAHSPNSACQQVTLSSIKSGEWQFLQELQAKAGTKYVPGVWLKGTKGARIWLALRQADADFKTYQEVPADLTGAWQFISIPSHITRGEKLTYMLHADKPATFCIDDASLAATPEAVTPDILARPVAATFGMHIENYLDSKGPANLNFEGSFRPVSSSRATITGSIANHWFDNSDWADVAVKYAANLASPHKGTKTQRIIVSSIKTGYVQAAQLAYLRLGQTYSASVWLRGTKGMKLGFALRKWTEPYTDYAAQDVAATGAWQRVSVSGKVTGPAVSALMVRAYSTGTLDFDDVSLRDASGAVPKLDLPWPSAPIGSWRLWDQDGTTWAKLEPEKGKWDFAALDQAVKDAETHKSQIVLTLGQSPPWAAARIGDTSYNGAGAPSEPRNMADWTTYLSKVATRYKGRIFYYEIWNEPNDPTFYTGSVAKLVEMTKLARTTLKLIDGRNKIVGASPYVVGYLQNYLPGVRQDIDVVGYHIYNDPPEDDARILADLRSVIQNNGLSAKPLWITEGATGNPKTPAAQLAGLAARKYLVQLTYGARRFYWYNWGPGHDIGLPMTKPDGVTPSAAGKTVAVLQKWLKGALIKKTAINSANTWVIKLQTPAGKPAYIIWNPTAKRIWTAPAGFTAKTVFDLAGKSKSAVAPIQATAEPLMVVGQ
jgi:Beta-galactosidase